MPAVNVNMYVEVPQAPVPLWCEKTGNITSITGINYAIPIGTTPAAGQSKPAALNTPVYYMNPNRNRMIAYVYIPSTQDIQKQPNDTQSYLMYVWNEMANDWALWQYSGYFRSVNNTVTLNGVTYDIYEYSWYDEDAEEYIGWSSNFCFSLIQK